MNEWIMNGWSLLNHSLICKLPATWVGVFVQLDMVVFQIHGKHAVYQLPSEPCTLDASSIGVEWSGNVTAVGSTRQGYGLGSAVEEFYVVWWPLKVQWDVWRLSDIRSLGDVLHLLDGFSQQGWLRGPRPFLEDKQSLRCCNLLRVPDKVTDRKNRSAVGLEALSAVSDVKATGAGMEADWNLETGRDWRHWHGGRQSLEELRLMM